MDYYLREIDRILIIIEKVLGDLEVLDNDYVVLDMVIENYWLSGILLFDFFVWCVIEVYI